MAPISPPRVFVYGTLREGFVNPGREILERYARFQALATVPGRLYEVRGLPVLSAQEQDRVHGEVYRFTAPERALEALDRYEGAAGTEPGPYERRQVTARLASGDRVQAWTYVWLGSLEEAVVVPEGDYASYVASNG